jgi:hypothetical protein
LGFKHPLRLKLKIGDLCLKNLYPLPEAACFKDGRWYINDTKNKQSNKKRKNMNDLAVNILNHHVGLDAGHFDGTLKDRLIPAELGELMDSFTRMAATVQALSRELPGKLSASDPTCDRF